MIDIVIAVLRDELSDFGDPVRLTRAVVRLLFAMALGACIGWERQQSGAVAGLRTHMLVALGVALMIVAAQQSGVSTADLSRVLQGIFAGVGFVGAAAIIRPSGDNQVHGVTTAASIWATAAIAAASGLGRVATAIMAMLCTVAILAWLRRVERKRALRGPDEAAPKPD